MIHDFICLLVDIIEGPNCCSSLLSPIMHWTRINIFVSYLIRYYKERI